MRHGTVMSLRGTASGWLFAAHRPRAAIDAVLAGEGTLGMDEAEFQERLAEVRRHGLGRAQDQAVPGVSALAAPVFDGTGAMVLSITVIGPSPHLDTRWDGAPARALAQRARDLSRRLGASASAEG